MTLKHAFGSAGYYYVSQEPNGSSKLKIEAKGHETMTARYALPEEAARDADQHIRDLQLQLGPSRKRLNFKSMEFGDLVVEVATKQALQAGTIVLRGTCCALKLPNGKDECTLCEESTEVPGFKYVRERKNPGRDKKFQAVVYDPPRAKGTNKMVYVGTFALAEEAAEASDAHVRKYGLDIKKLNYATPALAQQAVLAARARVTVRVRCYVRRFAAAPLATLT